MLSTARNASTFLRPLTRGQPCAAALQRRWASHGNFDVVIVGGGVIGSATALHLAELSPKPLRIAMLERDCTYQWASAPRSAGGIRQQFSEIVNIELSLYGIDFIKTGLPNLCRSVDVDPDVQFRENGYLVLASAEGQSALEQNVATQHACGATWIKYMDAAGLKARFPWLSTEGLVGGSFGERNEGYFDPWALLQAMRKAAVGRGVTVISQEVASIATSSSGSIETIKLIDGSEVGAKMVVNAAGAWSADIVEMCGANVAALPVKPRKRCVWAFKAGADFSSEGNVPRPPDNTPLTVDASGVWFRSEGSGGRFLCGVCPPDHEDPDTQLKELETVREDLFEDVIWPALFERAPAFESLKTESSWAGMYEYCTLDQNGIVGFHPDIPNMILATGFSGHGLQMSPGVGRAVTELVLHGEYKTVDLSKLSFDRVLKNEPFFEKCIY